jgi:DNA-directed RNA polymerase subunit RPC12/RpoP
MVLNIKQCPYCGDYFGAKLIEKHMGLCSKKNEVKEYICPECKKSFASEKDLKKHLALHEREPLAS